MAVQHDGNHDPKEAEFTAPASAQSAVLAYDQLKASQSSQHFWYVREPHPVMLADGRIPPARSMTELQLRSVQGRASTKKRAAQWQQIYGAASLAYLFVGHVDRYSPPRRLTRGCKRPSRVEVRILNQRGCTFWRIAWVNFRRSVVACGIGVQRVREPHHHGVCLNWHVCMTPDLRTTIASKSSFSNFQFK